MRTISAALLVVGTLALAAEPPEGGKWIRIFGDNFDHTALSVAPTGLDPARWDLTWLKDRPPVAGIASRHMVTADPRTALVTLQGGTAHLLVRRPQSNTVDLGYLNTHARFGTTYGYFEVRLKPSEVDGVQTAFWLMPFAGGLAELNRIDNSAVDGAEVDILETRAVGEISDGAFSTGILCDSYRTWPNVCRDTRRSVDTLDPDYRRTYGLFALHWTPEFLDVRYNNRSVHKITEPNRIPHIAMRLILSLGLRTPAIKDAVAISEKTVPLSRGALIDWVRVFKDNHMDWGDGLFVLTDTAGQRAVAATQEAQLKQAMPSKHDQQQHWMIERVAGCKATVYAIKHAASGQYIDPDTGDLSAHHGCDWAINYATLGNHAGQDGYAIRSASGRMLMRGFGPIAINRAD